MRNDSFLLRKADTTTQAAISSPHVPSCNPQNETGHCPVSRRLLRTLLCLLFGSIFLYAGALKARDPMTFLDDVRSFQILPDPYAAWLALALPWLEILAGLAVITGLLRPGGLLTLNALLLLFLGAILLSWARGLDLSCGCFGGDTSASDYPTLLLRDLALLALGLTCWKLHPKTLPS